MKKRLLILCLSLITLPMQAGAASLSFNLTSGSSIEVGEIISFDIVIGGLGDSGPDSLGGFSFDILYDDSIFNFATVSYGPLLGDINPAAFETDIFTTPAAGALGLSELSFLLDTELDVLQSASFTLASVELSGVAVGSSTLSFGSVVLSDAFGDVLPLMGGGGGGSLNIGVTDGSNSVDEPSILFLMLSSMLGMTYLKKKTILS